MKFLFHFYDLQQRAGIQRAICELSNSLIESGHEVTVACHSERSDVAYSLDDRVVLIPIPYAEPREARFATWLKKIWWAIRQATVLRNIVEATQPSVVVDHGTALGLLFPFRTISEVPFILQRHFPVKSFPYGNILYRLLSMVSGSKTVVALTEGIARDLRSNGYKNIAVIPNQIPLEAYPAPLSRDNTRVGLLMGRSTPQKGFDIFLEALSQADTGGWRFNIVGPGVDTDPLLRRLIVERSLEARVNLLPATKDPYSCIRESSCVIMPSRYEALPMVALEALTIGRSIIASDVDGLKDLIMDGINGLVFPRADVKALATCLERLCSDSSQYRELAENTQATIAPFSRSSTVEKWTRLVEILGNHRESASEESDARS